MRGAASLCASSSTTARVSSPCASLSAFQNTFLYVTRPIDPIAVEFPKQAEQLISSYDAFDAYRAAVQRAFVIMYALLTTIMLLSSIWFGLDFADRLVDADPRR